MPAISKSTRPGAGKLKDRVTKMPHGEREHFPHPPIFRFTSGIYSDCNELKAGAQDVLKSDYPRYSRFGTPVTDAVEHELTHLERGYGSLSACSGLAAITSVLLSFLRPGDHMLITRSVYEPVRRYVMTYLSRLGISATFLSSREFTQLERYVTENTTLIYVESPSSNVFEVTDIEVVAQFAKLRGIVTIMDNTWSTPLLLNPLRYGFDVVIHSASKYLSGHSDAIIGTITTTEQYYNPLRRYLIASGMCAGGEESFSLYKGLKTLALRLTAQQKTTQGLTEMLTTHPAVRRVVSPVLPAHTDHEVFRKYYQQGNGIFSFAVTKPKDSQRDVFLRRLAHFKLAYGWGGTESCIIPFSAPDWLPESDGLSFFRISVGIEEEGMLKTELSTALLELM